MIGSFNGSNFRGSLGGRSGHAAVKHRSIPNKKLTDDILKSRCRLCGESTKKKNYFFSVSGKALQLKRIIVRLCEVEVSERDELPSFVAEVVMIKLYV